ncbi:MAG: aldehyde dehydrogenase family protein, partial [Kangiellaceae bacterium]|nr:aldehyde dehydrogenase family protein [Kangiellaceae bacterium]
MQQFKMIINGKTEQSTDYFAVIDPATGETFAQCQSGSVATVDKAVEAARIAYLNWSQTSNDERIAAIHAIGAAIEKNMPELMKLVTQETGKPLNGLNGIGSGMEVGASIAWTHYNADLQLPIEVI